jgi:hypothetical protein
MILYTPDQAKKKGGGRERERERRRRRQLWMALLQNWQTSMLATSLKVWRPPHLPFTSQHNKSSSRGDVAAAAWAVSHHSTTDPLAKRPFSNCRSQQKLRDINQSINRRSSFHWQPASSSIQE